MKDYEIFNRLCDFADFLDGLESSKFKGDLNNFFVGYSELFKKYYFLMEKYNLKGD